MGFWLFETKIKNILIVIFQFLNRDIFPSYVENIPLKFIKVFLTQLINQKENPTNQLFSVLLNKLGA